MSYYKEMQERRTVRERPEGRPSGKPCAPGREEALAELAESQAGDSDLIAARRVLRLEAAAIETLARTLGSSFADAVERLRRVRGRVVVTGMGKSGHVARKIAATLASTGTPALFVHPAEASHGDLGMITREDAVLALSNSGETNELADLVAYTRRFGIPLVAITGGAASSLAEASDIALLLPNVPEACPLGLAPTTSTTVMLALGDALAIALLERRGFSLDQFQALHPGGSIGRQLLSVADVMHSGDAMPLTRPDVLMSEAILVMTAKHFGCVGVIDRAGKLIGIITDGDLRRHMGGAILEMTVGEVMTPAPQTIRPKALAVEALNLMNTRGIDNRGIGCLFAVEDGRPVGILNIHDCLRAGVS
ncbi:MAG TPA: KpsF/GutQ family sugar-phosphate isomerase [Alphaproteobacteria bacterium]|nr:KpsF/GutQ family sugar-phosphate isomerase [Alphaproteobacteria bacterium]